MIPAYNAQSFGNIDLRKYHIRDIKDVLRFIEFTVSRMDEAKHIINKTNMRKNTLEAVVKQMKAQQQRVNNLYGAPNTEEVIKQDKEAVQIQTAEEKKDKAAEQERSALLDEMRQAVAEEKVAPEEGKDPNARLEAEYEKYKAVAGKYRVMFYRDGENGGRKTLVSAKDVPEDIKAILLDALGKKSENDQTEVY